MNKAETTLKVEQYLNGKISEDNLLCQTTNIIDLEIYCQKTIKRLVVVYSLYVQDSAYINDFLMALRDYLLVFDTSIKIDSIVIPENNAYSIRLDRTSGEYYASFQFPEGVSQHLAESAFMRNLSSRNQRNEIENLRTDPLIYQLTGFTHFKSWAQKIAVYGALNTPDGYTTLVSLPTGGGKSLITQSLAYQKGGLTIVVVPTVSLAMDQVLAAKKNIHHKDVDQEIFSYSSGVDADPIINAINNQTARLLFISPEALLNNPRFIDIVNRAKVSRYLKNIVIDEAHIVVDWGASFRVDYQCLESWRKTLLLSSPSIRTILLSATFENKCIDTLQKLFSQENKWIEVRCDSLRHEPRYMLIEERSYKNKKAKLIELVQKLPHPMIIYVARPVEADDIKTLLNENGIYNVRTFTGLTGATKREKYIKEWKDDQFQIMIATSAFGVGVDKSDVRTVLHLYIPENPNAYYQELGRGGRDQLPCLSVICISPSDIETSRTRSARKVLTTEKIIGRWDSMYNNKKSKRYDNIIYIDTSIKPNYNVSDEFDDSSTSDTDRNWNIYVLLLLRRYSLINIKDIIIDNEIYLFAIDITDDRLRLKNEELSCLIEYIRTKEWNYYYEAHSTIEEALKNHNDVCWSEMFYKTYDKVVEYCGGCKCHDTPYNGDPYEKALKVPIKTPVKEVSSDQEILFGSGIELVVFASYSQRPKLIDALINMRLSILVMNSDSILQDFKLNDFSRDAKSLFVIGNRELRELAKKDNRYYISGLVAVVYPDEALSAWKQYLTVKNYLCTNSNVRVVHILKENIYFEGQEKMITDLIDGPVVNAEILY